MSNSWDRGDSCDTFPPAPASAQYKGSPGFPEVQSGPEIHSHMTDPAVRKQIPIISGCLDYFPDAIAYVAFVSYIGNQQHNPGKTLRWSRAKSSDHEDCIGRHTIQRGTFDTDGVRHAGKRAWRALAALQHELEKAYNLPTPRGAIDG